MEGQRQNGSLLQHPAGPFFALAAGLALILPWLWLAALDDPRMVHLRLGLFGFGAAAVTGYVLTAARAWTGRRPWLPLPMLLVLFVLGRIAAVAAPWEIWPALVAQLTLGVTVVWPVAAARVWSKLPLAAAPLALAGVEAAVVADMVPVRGVLLGMAALLLTVGGRAIPAFLRAEAKRRGQRPLPVPPLWPLMLLAAATAALAGWATLAALAAAVGFAALLLWRVRAAVGPGIGGANRMLALAWSTLAPALPALLLIPEGPTLLAAEHLFQIAAMGGTVLAFAARASMARPAQGGLHPHPLHVPALALLLVSAPLRVAAVIWPEGGWLVASGLGWSAAWAMFLAVHLIALPRPAPAPVLSAARLRQKKGATVGAAAPEAVQAA